MAKKQANNCTKWVGEGRTKKMVRQSSKTLQSSYTRIDQEACHGGVLGHGEYTSTHSEPRKMAACFTSRPMYQPGKQTPVPVDRTLVRSGLNNETNLSPLLRIERQFLCRPSHSLVTIMMSYIQYREFN
jgi:hypothetical protein